MEAGEREEWLKRVDELFEEVQEGGPMCLRRARRVLLSPMASSGEQERALLGLVGHPDPEAAILLREPRLRLRAPRVRFVHGVAKSWRAQREAQ